MPKQTQADEEMATPQKTRKVETEVSPAKTEPMSPMNHTITIQQRNQSRGLWGIGRPKTFLLGFFYLILIGGLVYFLLEWFEIPGLNEQLDRLEGEVDRLSIENDRYTTLNKQLEDTSEKLNTSVTELTVQVDELDKINQDLTSVVGFLNTTAGELGDSLDQITDFLATQIEYYKTANLVNLENLMRQRLNWSCNYGALFGQYAWGSDFDAEIPASAWDQVGAYVTENVLEELCLDEEDFKQFLSDKYTVWNSKNLISAVTAYTNAALDWYFPEEGEDGLTHDDWAAASFDCEKLPTQFKISLVST